MFVEPFWGRVRPLGVHSQAGDVGKGEACGGRKPVSKPSRHAVGQSVACGACSRRLVP